MRLWSSKMSGPFNLDLGQLTEFLFNRVKMFIKLRELETRLGYGVRWLSPPSHNLLNLNFLCAARPNLGMGKRNFLSIGTDDFSANEFSANSRSKSVG